MADEEDVQQQKEELEVLQSIFGDDFSALSIDRPPFNFCLSIHPVFGNDASLRLKLPVPPSKPDEATSNGPNSVVANPEAPTNDLVNVKYLPPILLSISFPRQYPSSLPPDFKLSCPWLSERHQTLLCTELDSIWLRLGPGLPIVFEYANWLQTSSMPSLNFDAENILLEYEKTRLDEDSIDERVAMHDDRNRQPDVQRVLFLIFQYSAMRDAIEFERRMHVCGVCLTEKGGVDLIRSSCGHFACKDCLSSYCTVLINEGAVTKLRCTEPKCKETFSPNVIKAIVTPELFGKYEQMLLEKTLETMQDVTYCPRCNTLVIEDSDQLGRCTSCFFNFCTQCLDDWHHGSRCISTEDKLRLLGQASKEGDAKSKNEMLRKKLLELKNELLTQQAIVRSGARACPHCSMVIEKTEGCNKMTCSNCGNYFCYRCGQKVHGYEHFQTNQCVLFDAEAVAAWNNMMHAPIVHEGHLAMQMRLQEGQGNNNNNVGGGGGGRHFMMIRCPTCGQENLKDSPNNHIGCWYCRGHFCALCRQVVKNSREHFGLKCRQHT
mmetsp:Transcript_22173/g.36744  ORF Transcript_22173/g.36744 Transcript_22173/m.36744 type:complete len:548 (-) Transcript_22173:27-1670(-)